MITASIISHGHGSMVVPLVESLLCCAEVQQIIVTRNIPETLDLPSDARIRLIGNAARKGFGANHNAAFAYCDQPFFCPVNPDISITADPFPELLRVMDAQGADLAAPLVQSVQGEVEDSLRRYPTIFSLIGKALSGGDGRYPVIKDDPPFNPEWAAGMFMLFRSDAFHRIGGFDESFFLYYEDVDICVRLWKAGMKIVACPSVSVIHDARRASRRNAKHMQWHAASMARYFWKHAGRLPEIKSYAQ